MWATSTGRIRFNSILFYANLCDADTFTSTLLKFVCHLLRESFYARRQKQNHLHHNTKQSLSRLCEPVCVCVCLCAGRDVISIKRIREMPARSCFHLFESKKIVNIIFNQSLFCLRHMNEEPNTHSTRCCHFCEIGMTSLCLLRSLRMDNSIWPNSLRNARNVGQLCWEMI